MSPHKINIAVVGLGYVGLPLAVAFAEQYLTTGFDIDEDRIGKLLDNVDPTGEVSIEELSKSTLRFTADPNNLRHCNVYIITVPTPVDSSNTPDLTPLIRASETVGELLKAGDTVIYESTVYPGATEEICVPVLERVSGLEFNAQFFVGYSPERINPGDKIRGVRDVMKVTSGSNDLTGDFVDSLYMSIIDAGTHRASSIKVAEAAKVIENSQRDLNIAFVNELSIIFNKLGIDTEEVLKAAGTKWNFLPFRPGLVGGHCIGVDPYYLTHKATEVGYHPQVILAGRRTNDGMGQWIAQQIIKKMASNALPIAGGRVLILGWTFKENCPDTRNSKVVDIFQELHEHGMFVDFHDTYMDEAESYPRGVARFLDLAKRDFYDAVVVAVAHDEYVKMGPYAIRKMAHDKGLVFDIKSVFRADETDWRL